MCETQALTSSWPWWICYGYELGFGVSLIYAVAMFWFVIRPLLVDVRNSR